MIGDTFSLSMYTQIRISNHIFRLRCEIEFGIL